MVSFNNCIFKSTPTDHGNDNVIQHSGDEVSVGTECTLVYCSLYTGCIYRVLTPRELKNQVVNLHCICNSFACVSRTRDNSTSGSASFNIATRKRYFQRLISSEHNISSASDCQKQPRCLCDMITSHSRLRRMEFDC
jgi:hypothetical protein